MCCYGTNIVAKVIYVSFNMNMTLISVLPSSQILCKLSFWLQVEATTGADDSALMSSWDFQLYNALHTSRRL